MTESQRMDGATETDADTRFFALRESGYTGPINLDGHPVAEDAPGPSTTARVGRGEPGRDT